MEGLKSFIWEYRYLIAVIVAAIFYAILEWQKVKTKLYALMLQAKSMAKDAILKSGDEQVEWVVNKAYQFLPSAITLLISRKMMIDIIGKLYDKGKDYLDDGKLNNSIK